MFSPPIPILLAVLVLLRLVSSANIDRIGNELDAILSQENKVTHKLVRSEKKRMCGRRLVRFIFATCGECEPGTDEDISLLCCAHQCDIHDVMRACCPTTLLPQ